MMEWFKNISLPRLGNGRVAAVDFDSRSLWLILAEVSSKATRITKAIHRDIPTGLNTQDPQAVGEFLGQLLREVHFHGAGVVMAISRSQVVLKPVTLPPGTPPEDYASMVNFQAAKQLPFPVEDAIVDFSVERHYELEEGGAAGQGVDTLVAAVRLAAVSFYRQLAEAAGVKLLRLGLRPYANKQCLDACRDRVGVSCFALVHMTVDETEINIIQNDSLIFTRATIQNLVFSPDETGRLAQAISTLVMEVARSLQSYQSVQRNVRIEKVFVTGGTGAETRVSEQLARSLNLPCEPLATEAVFTEANGTPIPGGYTSTIGLVGGYAATDQTHFDFVNPKRSPVKRDERKERLVLAGFLGMILMLLVFLGGWKYLSVQKNNLSQLQSRSSNLDKEIREQEAIADRVSSIENWRDEGRNWLDQWACLAAVLPSADEIYLTDLQTTASGEINFTVQARSSQAITQMGKALGEAGYQFRPGPMKTTKDSHGYVYNTVVRVVPSEDMKIDLASLNQVSRPAEDSTADEFYGQKVSEAPSYPQSKPDISPAMPLADSSAASPASPSEESAVIPKPPVDLPISPEEVMRRGRVTPTRDRAANARRQQQNRVRIPNENEGEEAPVRVWHRPDPTPNVQPEPQPQPQPQPEEPEYTGENGDSGPPEEIHENPDEGHNGNSEGQE